MTRSERRKHKKDDGVMLILKLEYERNEIKYSLNKQEIILWN